MADDIKTGLEELAKDAVSGAGAEGKVAESQQGTPAATDETKGGESSNGAWITSLPQDLREGVDASKYGSMADYLRDLKARAEGKDAHDEKAFTEGWDRYLEEMKSSGEMLPDSIQKVLKESGVDADTAKKLSKAVSEYGESVTRSASEAARKEMSDFISTEWKGTFQENNEALKRGLTMFGKKHPELMRRANERGSIYTPEFVQLMVDYARYDEALNREHNSPEGNSTPKEDPDNPFGLKNL